MIQKRHLGTSSAEGGERLDGSQALPLNMSGGIDNGIQSYVGGNVLIFLKTFLMKYLGVNATVGFPLKYVSKI